MSAMEGKVLGMGNPLLDISAEVNADLLEEYHVSLNNAILAEEQHLSIYKRLAEEYDVEYIAGGATQNSIRVCQWFLQTPNATSYIGSIGNDEFGKQLQKSATDDGVQTHYYIDPSTPTGTCAVLVRNKERSLIANLAAANNYDHDHLLSSEVAKVYEKACLIYISGFFLTVSPKSIMKVAEHCAQAKTKTFIMNLAAPFISSFFSEPLLEALPYCDIIVGNEGEASAFAEKLGYKDKSPENVARKLAAYDYKGGWGKRVAIITQGPNETIVCNDDELTKYAVPQLDESEIVDVNGAGDGFVGGLLAALAKGQTLEEAIHVGHYCASVVLRRSGTSLTGLVPQYTN